MFCKNCGSEILPDVKFCPGCGTPTEGTVANRTGNQPVCPKTYLVESILVTLFCCLPFGIVGIINAANVSSNFSAGRYQEAETASANAKKYTQIGAIIGAAAVVLYLIFLLIAAVMGGSM